MRELRDISSSGGFTLIEALIAMLVFVSASVALIPLLVWGITLQANSRNAIAAHSLAQEQIEELKAVPTTDTRLANGGNLATDVANHFNQPAGTPFTRRWTVAAGPAGTLDLTVTVVSNNSNVTVPPFQFQALLQP